MANGIIAQEVDLNSHFLIRKYTIDNISISANSVQSCVIDIPVDGYYPETILDLESMNASSSGINTSYAGFQNAHINYSSPPQLLIRITNYTTTASKVRVDASVLYRRVYS